MPSQQLLLLLHASIETVAIPTFRQHTSLDFGRRHEVQVMTGAIFSPGGGAEQQHRPPSMIISKKGCKKYRCHLPQTPNATSFVDHGTSLPSQQQVVNLLNPLRGSCFYRLEGWWTYQLCFMKSMRQYHQQGPAGSDMAADEVRVSQDYQLGLYWLPERQQHASDLMPSAAPPRLSTTDFHGELVEEFKTKRRYWRQQYGNGTRCDLTRSTNADCTHPLMETPHCFFHQQPANHPKKALTRCPTIPSHLSRRPCPVPRIDAPTYPLPFTPRGFRHPILPTVW
tara:strand:- start:2050 stop:2895 length:846 start_codon:yes stop_codon:yes gene_type:complete